MFFNVLSLLRGNDLPSLREHDHWMSLDVASNMSTSNDEGAGWLPRQKASNMEGKLCQDIATKLGGKDDEAAVSSANKLSEPLCSELTRAIYFHPVLRALRKPRLVDICCCQNLLAEIIAEPRHLQQKPNFSRKTAITNMHHLCILRSWTHKPRLLLNIMVSIKLI